MYIAITEKYLARLRTLPGTSGALIGERLDDGDVLRFFDWVTPALRAAVGRWYRNEADLAGITGQQGDIVAVFSDDTLRFYVWHDAWLDQPHELVRVQADVFARQQGLFDSAALARKRVGIVGVGSGGSLVASLLAKAGVGTIKLADFDRLAVHNVSRHVCGLNDLGRLKVDAVRDHLRNYSPIVQVETFASDITEDAVALTELVRGCDVVVGATDSEEAKGFLNREAWAQSVPAIYGSVYNMGYGGDVFMVQPPDGACYECFRNATAGIFAAQNKPAISDYGKVAPQPALELDSGIVASLVARTALTVLLRDDPSATLRPYPTNWVVWGNQPWEGWLFDEPLQSAFVPIAPDLLCPVCHYDDYVKAALDQPTDAVLDAAQTLFEGLPSRDEAINMRRRS